MALNRGNFSKYVEATAKKGGTSGGSAEDRLELPKGDIDDMLIAVIPPVKITNGEEHVTYPEQERGIFTPFKKVHPKVGKGGQQKVECLSNWKEECLLCKDSKTTNRWSPYVVLLKETTGKDGSTKYIPISKPLVADFPSSLGDEFVSVIKNDDNNPNDDLFSLPVYKYSRKGKMLDTTHTLVQRPEKHKFDLRNLVYLDAVKEGDKTSWVLAKDPVNPVFANFGLVLEYVSTSPLTRVYKPSMVRMQAAAHGLDVYMKDETLKAMISAYASGGSVSNSPADVSITEIEITDDDLPF